LFTPQPDTRDESEIPLGQERITWAKGSYKTAHGNVVSEWKIDDGVFKYYCEAPVRAQIVLPQIPNKSEVIINGKSMKLSDLSTDDTGRVFIDIESGKYTLEM
jgi:hypothetical protein